jgi:hypothetical protein
MHLSQDVQTGKAYAKTDGIKKTMKSVFHEIAFIAPI